MQPDLKDESHRWLAQARADLRDARTLAQEGSHAAACFFAQQAAEKAMKGILFAQGQVPPRTHHVSELMRIVARHVRLPEQLSVIGGLDGYYAPTRYPDAVPDAVPDDTYGESDSAHAIGVAGEAVGFAAKCVEGTEKVGPQ